MEGKTGSPGFSCSLSLVSMCTLPHPHEHLYNPAYCFLLLHCSWPAACKGAHKCAYRCPHCAGTAPQNFPSGGRTAFSRLPSTSSCGAASSLAISGRLLSGARQSRRGELALGPSYAVPQPHPFMLGLQQLLTNAPVLFMQAIGSLAASG
jgi:hypothetical protein